MATRWQGMGTKEAAGYKEKIDTAWDDIYMGDKRRSSGRSAFRNFLKIAGGLGIANLYGSRQVEKYGNDALSRANDIRLDLQQQELMLQNDIRAASIVGNREKRMMEDGIIDYQDPQQIMEWIVNNSDTGLDKDKVAQWNEKYGSGKALEGGVSQYNFEDTSTIRDIFNDEQARKAENLFTQHMRTAAHYKGLRGPGNIMPYMITDKEGKTIIEDQGYLNNVRAAVANIDAITVGIKKDVETMKWTDGILLKLGIKKLDREFIIKEQIAEEVNRKTSAEVRRRLEFDLKRTGADENLTAQLQIRIEQGINKDIKNMDINSAFKVLNIVTPSVGKLTGQAEKDIYMSSEQYISEIAEQAVTNTLNNKDGTITASMVDIVESAKSEEIIRAKYTGLIGERTSALETVKQTLKDLNLPPDPIDIAKGKFTGIDPLQYEKPFDEAFDAYHKVINDQTTSGEWNEAEFNVVKDKLGVSATDQLKELEFGLINSGVQLLPYVSPQRQTEIINQLRYITGKKDSILDILGEKDKEKTNFNTFTQDKLESGWNAFMHNLGQLKEVRKSNSTLNRVQLKAIMGDVSDDTIDSLAQEILGTQYNYGKQWKSLNKEGRYTGSDLQTRYAWLMGNLTQIYMATGKDEFTSQNLASLDIIASLTYVDDIKEVSIPSLFTDKIFGAGMRKDPQTNQLPLSTRIYQAEEQYANIDIEEALNNLQGLDIDQRGQLLLAGENYRMFMSGKDLPPNMPSFNELDDKEQLRYLLKTVSKIMGIDSSFESRLQPDVIRVVEASGNYANSQDRETAISILNNMITQEFNLIQLLKNP